MSSTASYKEQPEYQEWLKATVKILSKFKLTPEQYREAGAEAHKLYCQQPQANQDYCELYIDFDR